MLNLISFSFSDFGTYCFILDIVLGMAYCVKSGNVIKTNLWMLSVNEYAVILINSNFMVSQRLIVFNFEFKLKKHITIVAGINT